MDYFDSRYVAVRKISIGYVESYSYEDTVNYEGELKREEYENPDGSVGYLYSIYDGSEFIIGLKYIFTPYDNTILVIRSFDDMDSLFRPFPKLYFSTEYAVFSRKTPIVFTL